jgi:mannose-6-phosphate isomerase-like protein (cupin superfamily)
MSLAEMMAKRVARRADRRDDWSVFGLETELDPKFARSQRRYIGASGSVGHEESNAVEPAAFTMSVQTMPVGHRIPVHCHETEETFFILEGECIVNVFHEGETVTLKLGQWDLVSVPPFVYHDIHNAGTIPCPIQTLLSKQKPDRPHYQDPRLLEIQARTHTN